MVPGSNEIGGVLPTGFDKTATSAGVSVGAHGKVSLSTHLDLNPSECSLGVSEITERTASKASEHPPFSVEPGAQFSCV